MTARRMKCRFRRGIEAIDPSNPRAPAGAAAAPAIDFLHIKVSGRDH